MGKGRKITHNWIKTYALAFALILVLGSVVIPMRSYAVDEVTDVSVTVGCWGGEDYVKDEVSLSRLASACGTHREVYTWISNGSTPGTTEAEGIYLLDIMSYFGVDVDSVESYNFYTQDAATYSGSTQQWTTGQLFGSRYSYAASFRTAVEDFEQDREDYLRNPESHYTIADIYDSGKKKYTDEAWNNRYNVEPMLALKTKSNSWKGYTPGSNLDFSGMEGNGKPILVFGQAGRTDITRNLMAQMVSKIHIWYAGAPSIELEAQEAEGKVGDKKTYNLTVTTPDEFLSQKIMDQVKIESSDNTVAKINKDGTVTITGEGTAQISAVYNGTTYGSITMTGMPGDKKEEEQKPTEATEAAGSGSGSGSSQGNGSGSSSGANTGTGAGTGTETNESQGSGNSVSNHKSTDSQSKPSGISLKTDQRTGEASKQGSAGGAASGSGDSKVKVYTISEADQVYVERQSDGRVNAALGLLGLLAAGGGTAGEVIYFRSQVNWVKRAKRIYQKL